MLVTHRLDYYKFATSNIPFPMQTAGLIFYELITLHFGYGNCFRGTLLASKVYPMSNIRVCLFHLYEYMISTGKKTVQILAEILIYEYQICMTVAIQYVLLITDS